MSKTFLTAIDLNKNEIQNAVVQNLPSAPATPLKGQMYFNSTGGDNTLYWWDGAIWVAAKPPSTSGITQAQGDALYVNVDGDTMTGKLTVSNTAQGVLDIVRAAAGSVAQMRFLIQGSVVVGTMTGNLGGIVFDTPGPAASGYNYSFSAAGAGGFTVTPTVTNFWAPLSLSLAPTDPYHLTNKYYVDTANALMVLKSGDTMTGTLNGTDFVASNSVSGTSVVGTTVVAGTSMSTPLVTITTATPAAAAHAARKDYVDTQRDTRVAKTGDTMTGLLVLSADPSAALGAATKQYVDNLTAGLSWKEAVRVASTANATLASAFANGSVVDGVTLATNDRILIKNQTTATENGIYTVNASGAPTRSTDANAVGELEQATVFVAEGTTLADTSWVCTTNGTITPGSTPTAWAQFSSSGGSVAPTRNIYTTAPLTGGGDLSTDRTLAVSQGTSAAVGVLQLATAVEATAQTDNAKAVTPLGLADRVKNTLTFTGTAPIQINGLNTAQALSANQVLSILAASTTVVGATRLATTAEATAMSLATVAVTPAGLADRALTTTAINTTAPLTGGGTLAATRTLDISTFTSTVKGAVPPPTTVTGKFLRDDGSWQVAGQVAKYSLATVGGSTAQVITHNLNSQAVVVNVYRTLTPWDTVECDIERTTVNTITLRFAVAPATNEYSVVVIG